MRQSARTALLLNEEALMPTTCHRSVLVFTDELEAGIQRIAEVHPRFFGVGAAFRSNHLKRMLIEIGAAAMERKLGLADYTAELEPPVRAVRSSRRD